MKKTQAMIANLCLSNKPVISSRVLCDVQRTRSTFRAVDRLLLCKDNLCYYMDRAWRLFFLFVVIANGIGIVVGDREHLRFGDKLILELLLGFNGELT